MKTKKYRWLFLLLILWAIFIVAFSAQPWSESFHTSSVVEDFILKMVSWMPGGQDFAKQLLEIFPVRKIAHFVEYMILGGLSAASWVLYQAEEQENRKPFFLIAWGSCVLFAVLDELHQAFVPGRTSSIRDVLLDSVGALFGAFLVAWIVKHVIKNDKEV